jgi:hypothetical protein
MGFQVTPKDGRKSLFLRELPYALPHLVFVIIALAAELTGSMRVMALVTSGQDEDLALVLGYAINMLWTAFIVYQVGGGYTQCDIWNIKFESSNQSWRS